MSWQTADLLFADTTDVLAADTTDVLPADTTRVLPADKFGVGWRAGYWLLAGWRVGCWLASWLAQAGGRPGQTVCLSGGGLTSWAAPPDY